MIISVSDQSIEIIEDTGSMKRFPNQLIWDINSLLSQKYQLFEWSLFQRKPDAICIKLKNRIAYKFIGFFQLDSMFIEKSELSRKNGDIEYWKHKNEIPQYEDFIEAFSMEYIDSMDYIGVCEMRTFLDSLKKQLNSMRFTSYRKLSKALSELADCSIHIEHHSYIKVVSKHAEELDEVLEITRKYFR